jgi:hypothetical protein
VRRRTHLIYLSLLGILGLTLAGICLALLGDAVAKSELFTQVSYSVIYPLILDEVKGENAFEHFETRLEEALRRQDLDQRFEVKLASVAPERVLVVVVSRKGSSEHPSGFSTLLAEYDRLTKSFRAYY